jgi:hypothetical protein
MLRSDPKTQISNHLCKRPNARADLSNTAEIRSNRLKAEGVFRGWKPATLAFEVVARAALRIQALPNSERFEVVFPRRPYLRSLVLTDCGYIQTTDRC